MTDSVSSSDIIALMASSVGDLAVIRDDARKRGDAKTLLAAVREIRGLEPVLERSGITEATLGDELKARDRLVSAVKFAARTRPAFATELATAMRAIRDDDSADQLDALAAHLTDQNNI